MEHYAKTGDPTYSAAKAGYAHPVQRAAQNLGKPAVNDAIRAAQAARLTNDELPLAIDVIHNVMMDEKQPGRTRLDAAKFVVLQTIGRDEGKGSKEAHEMTGDELQAALDRLRREAADRARQVIEHDPAEASTIAEAAGKTSPFD